MKLDEFAIEVAKKRLFVALKRYLNDEDIPEGLRQLFIVDVLSLGVIKAVNNLGHSVGVLKAEKAASRKELEAKIARQAGIITKLEKSRSDLQDNNKKLKQAVQANVLESNFRFLH